MPEHTFTFEQIRHQAQENALAYLLASVVYFKEQNHSPHQFMAAVGHTLAPGWKDLKGHGHACLAYRLTWWYPRGNGRE